MNFSSAFTVVGISDRAIPGGNPNFDLISPQTAYLYSRFRAGTLPADFSTDISANFYANALQDAIWILEDEAQLSDLDSKPDLQDQTEVYLKLASESKWTDIGNVRVMNLTWGGGTTLAQDQLVLAAPEPGTLLLVGLSLGGLVPLLRRRKK